MTFKNNALFSALAVAGLGVMLSAAPSAAQAARPAFSIPFPCGTAVDLKTRLGHSPDDKKIDMFSRNTRVLASAGGLVHEHFNPGGIEIAHGDGWFTTYMHMTDRVAVGTRVRQGQKVGTMSNVGPSGMAVHLHYEQLYNPNSSSDADNQHIVKPILQGVALRYNASNQTYTPGRMTSENCGGTAGGKHWIDIYAAAPGFASPTSTDRTGTLNAGINYVYCKKRGREIRQGNQFNTWWFKTDLDTGPANQWISAFYLEHWGNNEAKDNEGRVIPDC